MWVVKAWLSTSGTYHVRTRTRGVNPFVYWPTRLLVQPLLMLLFRVSRIGREHIPATGGLILAPNHRSFLDPWVVGICLRRPVYFVAKRELFAEALDGLVPQFASGHSRSAAASRTTRRWKPPARSSSAARP